MAYNSIAISSQLAAPGALRCRVAARREQLNVVLPPPRVYVPQLQVDTALVAEDTAALLTKLQHKQFLPQDKVAGRFPQRVRGSLPGRRSRMHSHGEAVVVVVVVVVAWHS